MKTRVSAPVLSVALVTGLAMTAVATGCASSSGGAARADARADADRAEGICQDGCTIRVENRLSGTRIEVTGSRLEGVDRFGVVEPNSSGTFEVTADDVDGDEARIWIFDADSGERIELERVRSFPGGVGRVVVDSR